MHVRCGLTFVKPLRPLKTVSVQAIAGANASDRSDTSTAPAARAKDATLTQREDAGAVSQKLHTLMTVTPPSGASGDAPGLAGPPSPLRVRGGVIMATTR